MTTVNIRDDVYKLLRRKRDDIREKYHVTVQINELAAAAIINGLNSIEIKFNDGVYIV